MDGDADREAFKNLWTKWKAGKGKADVEAEKARLLATASVLVNDSFDGDADVCEASLRYLRAVREVVLERVRADAGQANSDPVVLYRGIRGGRTAALFRSNPTPATACLLSYSTRCCGGITFASMGNVAKADGLLYTCSVPLTEIVFFEDTELCDQYPDEYEVLVLHATVPADVSVVEPNVKPRAKISFGKKSGGA